LTDKAVILAAGLGTRMRREDPQATLSPEQEAVARTGVKALMPIGGRAFLDYVLSALAEVGIRRICLVISARTEAIRRRCAQLELRRLSISFATQERPLRTADALLAAREFSGDESFLLVNSDNYYPSEALGGLMGLESMGVLALERDKFLAQANSNIDSARMAQYALLETDGVGRLLRILEKPDPETYAAFPAPARVSVNAWRLDGSIFEACRSIAPSPRGELELPSAVQYAIDHRGAAFEVVSTTAPILDLSLRADIPIVSEKLRGYRVDL